MAGVGLYSSSASPKPGRQVEHQPGSVKGKGLSMLKIRIEQMEALNQAASSAFYQRLIRFLRKEIPEATSSMDETALIKHIIESEQRAAQYNIVSEAGIAQFVCLTFAAGPEFDAIPEVRDYLEQPGLNAEEKLDELINYLNALEDDPDTNPLDVLLDINGIE